MPLHRYQPCSRPCRLCGEGFEHRSGPHDPPLTQCPTCGQAVERAGVEAVNTPKLSAPLSVSQAKSSGFTMLRRTCDGSFEKL